MRMIVPVLTAAIAAIFTTPAALAESFDTKYPVCMKTFASSGVRMDCYFWTMGQCWAKTDGMAALCEPNQYFIPSVLAEKPARRSP